MTNRKKRRKNKDSRLGFSIFHHNSSKKSGSRQSPSSQAIADASCRVASAVIKIHSQEIGTPISSSELSALTRIIDRDFKAAIRTGVPLVVLDSGDLLFKIDVDWYKLGASLETAPNHVTFVHLNGKGGIR